MTKGLGLGGKFTSVSMLARTVKQCTSCTDGEATQVIPKQEKEITLKMCKGRGFSPQVF